MMQKIRNIIGVMAIVIFLGYLLVTGISDLTNKKDLVTLNIGGALPIFEVEHSINGIIPTGTDYYYFGVENEKNNAYIIKGPKKWISNNFSEEHKALDKDGVIITGLVKKVFDYDVRNELVDATSTIEGIQLPYTANYYIDLDYKENAIGKLLLLLITALIGICVLAYCKLEFDEKVSKLIWCFIVVASIIWLVLLFKVVI